MAFFGATFAAFTIRAVETFASIPGAEWSMERFRALLVLGKSLDLNRLMEQTQVSPVTVLLLPVDVKTIDENLSWMVSSKPQVMLLATATGITGVDPSLPGPTLLSTLKNGWIELTTDGRQLWVVVERH